MEFWFRMIRIRPISSQENPLEATCRCGTFHQLRPRKSPKIMATGFQTNLLKSHKATTIFFSG